MPFFPRVESIADTDKIYTGETCQILGYWCNIAMPSVWLLYKLSSFTFFFFFAAATTEHEIEE